MRKVIGWKVPQVFVIAPDEEIDIRLLSREKLYSDNYFPGLATIINIRKSHFPFLTQPQLKLS